MEIIDISDRYINTYCNCLEEWSDEMKESGTHKRIWFDENRKKGLRVKLAKNESDEIVGMIHYVPIEYAPVLGKDIYYIYCIWVHGYKEGVGNYQKRGIGKLLLNAAENDARALGAKGIAAWGIRLPFFMRSAWFKKQGYARADTDGMLELVVKPFSQDMEMPELIRMRKKPEPIPDKVHVTCFKNGWCPAQNIVYERAVQAAGLYPGKVIFTEIDTNIRENLLEWGISDGLFIDSKQIQTGPPPTYESIRNKIEKQLKKQHLI